MSRTLRILRFLNPDIVGGPARVSGSNTGGLVDMIARVSANVKELGFTDGIEAMGGGRGGRGSKEDPSTS